MDEKSIHQYSLRVHQAAALYTAARALPTVLHLPRRIDKRPDRIRVHASYLRIYLCLCLHFPCSPPQPQAAPPLRTHRLCLLHVGHHGVLMCCAIVGANSGLGADYLRRVIQAYVLAMPVAFVCVMVVRPLVGKLVAATVHL